ncbi:MAG: YfhO family protein [Actinomycetota bacterium]
MKTVPGSETAPATAPLEAPPSRARRLAAALAGPALIVVSVTIALRGFAFSNLLTNQHPDILSFWLPRSCLMARALSSAHVPLWNPFEMLGTPFAADPQSGWLSAPQMLFSWLFGCGGGLRAFIVAQPLLAGLGLWWFLRREGLSRSAATAGGLSLAMMISASNVAVSLPFAGTLAWTPFCLVGASGYFSAERWPRRLAWLALAAFAWGQVAAAHMSHGLVMCTALLVAYVAARATHEVRIGALSGRRALAMSVGFMTFLPLANLAIFVPRFALIERSSLRGGYGSLGGTLARAAGVADDRPLPTRGIWSAWPLALGSTPGAYAGAAILLSIAMAIRDRARRYLVFAVALAGLVAYLLTLNMFVSAGWFRSLVLRLPFGDVYLHNPGRLRYLALLVVPILGAVGIQSILDRPPPVRAIVRWVGGGIAIFFVLPLVLGAFPKRFLLLGVACAATVPILLALVRGRRWARMALVGILAVDLLGSAVTSSAYTGGTVYVGLEGKDHPALAFGPLRWPNVPLDGYLEPGPIARSLQAVGPNDGRYLAWIPPAAYFNKGYLFTQRPEDWPALLLGRAIVFGLDDTLGYSPIQLPRYWSYIRATDRLPVFYNASVLQLPSDGDVRLLGIRFVIAPEGAGLPPGLVGTIERRDHGYVLYQLQGSQPRVSVVPHWTQTDGVHALAAVLERGFNPAIEAVVEGAPTISHAPSAAPPGSATYAEVHPEDVRVTVDATAPSVVVIRNAWDRGWSATVDGRTVPVLRADYLLQGVPVPAGHHEIRLTYRDPTVGVGLGLSGVVWLAFVLALGWLLVTSRRRKRSRRRAARATLSPDPPPAA